MRHANTLDSGSHSPESELLLLLLSIRDPAHRLARADRYEEFVPCPDAPRFEAE